MLEQLLYINIDIEVILERYLNDIWIIIFSSAVKWLIRISSLSLSLSLNENH